MHDEMCFLFSNLLQIQHNKWVLIIIISFFFKKKVENGFDN